MRLFYFAPWPATDPLSSSTVEPHLRWLASDSRVDAIRYFSCEKGSESSHCDPLVNGLPAGVRHHPLPGPSSPIPLLRRVQNHRCLSARLMEAAAREQPDLVICRGTTGIFGDLLHRRVGIPYVVESFEPHAHYMRQTGTWSRWDPKYLVQRRWEERVKRSAIALLTVSHGYARHLQCREGINPSRLHTVPCWVDGERFRLDSETRARLRRRLGIGDRLAVVYAGKFSGIYSPLEELSMLQTLHQALRRQLFVIVLTAHDADDVRHQLTRCGIGLDQSFVDCVAYEQVGAYLNAADLALSFWSSGPWSFACSPIKHGEAWACGLPLLMPPGVGDEAQWLEAERAGAIATFTDPGSVAAAAQRLQPILAEAGHRQRIRAIGLRERGPESLQRVYRQLLNQFSGTSPAHG